MAPLTAHDFDDDDDHERGGLLDGEEELQEEVALVATAEAPIGARGSAEIEAENEDGVSSATLEVETEGLLPGIYTVSVVSLADGTSTTVLGTFPVEADSDDCDEDDDMDGDDEGENESDHHDGHRESSDHKTEGELEIGKEDGLAFPDGFNPFDIGSVLVTDANGVIVLGGDFSSMAALTKCTFRAKVSITPGPAAPAATGHATVAARVRRHTMRQKFLLIGENLPANALLTLRINGQPAGTVQTTEKGKVKLKRLPSGILAPHVTSVTLEDASASSVLKAHF